MAKLEIIEGNILDEPTDAIVNAANSALQHGGGIAAVIERAAGPELTRECNALPGCMLGDAVATSAGQLPFRHVIHAVGPRWSGGNREEPRWLASAHRRSVELAASLGDRSLSFPAISCGIFGYPPEKAAPVALGAAVAAAEENPTIELVRFVLFDDPLFGIFTSAARHEGLLA